MVTDQSLNASSPTANASKTARIDRAASAAPRRAAVAAAVAAASSFAESFVRRLDASVASAACAEDTSRALETAPSTVAAICVAAASWPASAAVAADLAADRAAECAAVSFFEVNAAAAASLCTVPTACSPNRAARTRLFVSSKDASSSARVFCDAASANASRVSSKPRASFVSFFSVKTRARQSVVNRVFSPRSKVNNSSHFISSVSAIATAFVAAATLPSAVSARKTSNDCSACFRASAAAASSACVLR